ncbi:MAG: hypothetical protein JNJ40_14710 [Bacteroidia bacterium]|nr:hypothetical protein [Bacteroidia bacterium]
MKTNDYKILEDRRELTPEQVTAGMNFGMIQKKVVAPKSISLNTMIIAGIGTVAIVSAIFIYRAFSSESEIKKEEPVIPHNTVIPAQGRNDSSDTVIEKENVADTVKEKILVNGSHAEIKQDEKTVDEEFEIIESAKPVRSLSFQRLPYADVEAAIEIKDSVYGPVNVSKGYGEHLEYSDKNNARYKEMNSAWFKFTIKRDTLLTFHIVPTLGTDDYDFALFKCNTGDCERALRANKINPLRVCFSWNSSKNHNTGLSNMAKDTLFEEEFINGEKQGKTYVSALKVKACDTYYLMVTNNLRVQKNQDPEGFMIYFYNYLPKRKANKYK